LKNKINQENDIKNVAIKRIRTESDINIKWNKRIRDEIKKIK
jgi:hypothetical protein